MRKGPTEPALPDADARASAAFEAEALALGGQPVPDRSAPDAGAADAEDLVQDTYLKAFRAADRFEPERICGRGCLPSFTTPPGIAPGIARATP
jgi:hypothetical protein